MGAAIRRSWRRYGLASYRLRDRNKQLSQYIWLYYDESWSRDCQVWARSDG